MQDDIEKTRQNVKASERMETDLGVLIFVFE